mmetsp:Transcript_31623/g.98387  ORF Transcript_31623/g.98387 Transcript_31623/m.98387 type:complete len:238 (+) Transcript_31623:231-944(+)
MYSTSPFQTHSWARMTWKSQPVQWNPGTMLWLWAGASAASSSPTRSSSSSSLFVEAPGFAGTKLSTGGVGAPQAPLPALGDAGGTAEVEHSAGAGVPQSLARERRAPARRRCPSRGARTQVRGSLLPLRTESWLWGSRPAPPWGSCPAAPPPSAWPPPWAGRWGARPSCTPRQCSGARRRPSAPVHRGLRRGHPRCRRAWRGRPPGRPRARAARTRGRPQEGWGFGPGPPAAGPCGP